MPLLRGIVGNEEVLLGDLEVTIILTTTPVALSELEVTDPQNDGEQPASAAVPAPLAEATSAPMEPVVHEEPTTVVGLMEDAQAAPASGRAAALVRQLQDQANTMPTPPGGTPLAAVQEDAELVSPLPQRPAAQQAEKAQETDEGQPMTATSSASKGQSTQKRRRRPRRSQRIARKIANKAKTEAEAKALRQAYNQGLRDPEETDVSPRRKALCAELVHAYGCYYNAILLSDQQMGWWEAKARAEAEAKRQAQTAPATLIRGSAAAAAIVACFLGSKDNFAKERKEIML